MPESTGSDTLALCIVCPTIDTYSETFIHAHLKRLSPNTSVLFGGFVPKESLDEGRLLSQSVVAKLYRASVTRLLRLPPRAFTDRAVTKYLTAHRVQVVLAQYGPTATAVMDACAAARVPLVAQFRGFDAYRRSVLDEQAVAYVRLFSQAAAIVTTSRDMAERLAQLGAPTEKLHCNPSGVDVDMFVGAQPAAARPVFVSTGRFVAKKAPHLTLLAFARVLEGCPEARLLMVGDGPLLETCRQMAAALRLDAAVEFLGALSHTQVAESMRGARAFVQHSLTAEDGDSEGTPVAVMEAGASGLPVVATRHGGIVDAVVHEETGFLVPEGDVDGMADFMLRLARDPALAGRMGAQARPRIVEHFAMDVSIRRMQAILLKAAVRRPN